MNGIKRLTRNMIQLKINLKLPAKLHSYTFKAGHNIARNNLYAPPEVKLHALNSSQLNVARKARKLYV